MRERNIKSKPFLTALIYIFQHLRGKDADLTDAIMSSFHQVSQTSNNTFIVFPYVDGNSGVDPLEALRWLLTDCGGEL